MGTSLEMRILEISYKHKLSHLSSNLTAVGIIDRIYSQMGPEDKFILSCGHVGLALYVVLEKYFGYDAEELFLKHGVHPHTDPEHKIYCSTGSLGMGIAVAVGAALASPDLHFYCLISDGECAEGSVWEALRFIADKPVKNISIIVNMNGYSACGTVNSYELALRLRAFIDDIELVFSSGVFVSYPFLKGVNGHYHVMSKEEYEGAISIQWAL